MLDCGKKDRREAVRPRIKESAAVEIIHIHSWTTAHWGGVLLVPCESWALPISEGYKLDPN